MSNNSWNTNKSYDSTVRCQLLQYAVTLSNTVTVKNKSKCWANISRPKLVRTKVVTTVTNNYWVTRHTGFQ